LEKEKKDLYAIIAAKCFHNNYEDNLEFHVAGKAVEVDGKQIISGSGKEFNVKTDSEDTITVKFYDLLETSLGDAAAIDLNIGDKILSDIGELIIVSKNKINDEICFKLSL